MFSEKQSGWLETANQAVYIVSPDDVILLAGKAGVGMNRKAGTEWIREHASSIEAVINKYIQEHV